MATSGFVGDFSCCSLVRGLEIGPWLAADCGAAGGAETWETPPRPRQRERHQTFSGYTGARSRHARPEPRPRLRQSRSRRAHRATRALLRVTSRSSHAPRIDPCENGSCRGPSLLPHPSQGLEILVDLFAHPPSAPFCRCKRPSRSSRASVLTFPPARASCVSASSASSAPSDRSG